MSGDSHGERAPDLTLNQHTEMTEGVKVTSTRSLSVPPNCFKNTPAAVGPETQAADPAGAFPEGASGCDSPSTGIYHPEAPTQRSGTESRLPIAQLLETYELLNRFIQGGDTRASGGRDSDGQGAAPKG